MDAVAFGSRAEADRLTRRVRAVHGRVRGNLDEPAGRFPAGTPYRADDPELLLWILAALADSGMLVYGKYVRRLDRDDRDALWRDYRIVGARFGLADHEMPATIEAFDAYMDAMLTRGDLFVTPQAPSSRPASCCIRLSPAPAPAARARQPGHSRAAAAARPPHVRVLVGPAAIARAPRRRRVRRRRGRADAAGPDRPASAGASRLACAGRLVGAVRERVLPLGAVSGRPATARACCAHRVGRTAGQPVLHRTWQPAGVGCRNLERLRGRRRPEHETRDGDRGHERRVPSPPAARAGDRDDAHNAGVLGSGIHFTGIRPPASVRGIPSAGIRTGHCRRSPTRPPDPRASPAVRGPRAPPAARALPGRAAMSGDGP